MVREIWFDTWNNRLGLLVTVNSRKPLPGSSLDNPYQFFYILICVRGMPTVPSKLSMAFKGGK